MTFTWVSTANVVEYMGAKPVFCDIDLRTFNIDLQHLAALITSHGRHYPSAPVWTVRRYAGGGNIARQHHLWVVEDAACALGAWYQGSRTGYPG